MDYRPEADDIIFLIARETGVTLAEAAELPQPTVDAWAEHFKRWPPGDFGTQYLLALIASQNYNRALAESGKRTGFKAPHDIAPWLLTPELAELLKKKELSDAAARVSGIIADKINAG